MKGHYDMNHNIRNITTDNQEISDNIVPIPNNLSKFSKGLHRYLKHHIKPGGFLTAVLENDLVRAILLADDESKELITDLVVWIYNNLPAVCWGSKEAVERWVNGGNKDG